LVVLGILVAVAVAMFMATRSLANLHRGLQRQDAAVLYDRGIGDLSAGQPAAAVESLRRAAAIEIDNETYALAFSAAFEAAGNVDSARAVLVGLRGRRPEDPEINLRLARLSRRSENDDDAVRYYQSALYGAWPIDAAEVRQIVRLEFVRYLLVKGETSRALSELIAMEDRFTKTAASQTEAGDLFLRAEDPRRALGHFRTALRLDPHFGEARAGAGTAAYRVGAYPQAMQYLRSIEHRDSDHENMLAVATFVVTRDPLAPRLPYAERRRRLRKNVEDALTRLQTCQATTPDAAAALPVRQEAQTLHRRLRRAPAGQQPLQVIEDGLDLVRRIEDAADRRCPTRQPIDRALVILAERRRIDRQ
jgi:tetratricopeptide (TPR) repeat protein